MRRFAAIYAICLLTALCGVATWGCFGLTRHIIVAVDQCGDAGAQLAQAGAKMNGQHGAIAMLDEDTGAAKSLIVHADLVARHEQQSLGTWDDRGTTLFNNLNGGITDLRGTVTAATGTANAATAALGEGQRTIAAAQPVLSEAQGLVSDLHKSVPDIARNAKASANAMEHANGILADGQKIGDHYEQIIDNPKKSPWFLRMLPGVVRVAIEAALDKWAVSQ